MQAQLHTYYGEELRQVENIDISPDYDGDPYGDTITFAVGSNQQLITDVNNFRCEQCCGVDPDYIADPYITEMYNETCMVWLCDYCYRDKQLSV